MTVGQRIAQKRKELGLSQEALGDRLGVTRQSIYKWESDSALPEVEKLITLAKLFGVSVGWLLGVEEVAAPENSGELSETQRKMVEEIVDRYIAALPKPDPQRQRRFFRRGAVVFAALFCACFFAIFSLFARLDRMDQQYSSLQEQIVAGNGHLSEQVQGISQQVNDINSITSAYEVSLLETDYQKGEVLFYVRAIPKTYVEGMTAAFTAMDGTGGDTAPGEPDSPQGFMTVLRAALTNYIEISVLFTYPDGTSQTQLLESYENLYSDSLPNFSVSSSLDEIKMSSPGVLRLLEKPGSTAGIYVYTSVFPQKTVRVKDARVGLFLNKQLVDWAEPCEKPNSYHGYEDCTFYRLPNTELSLTAADELCVAAVLTDEYGRTSMKSGLTYTLTSDGTHLAVGAPYDSRHPADWIYD